MDANININVTTQENKSNATGEKMVVNVIIDNNNKVKTDPDKNSYFVKKDVDVKK